MKEKPFYLYQDDRVGVRPLVPEDVGGGYQHWLNDPEVCRYSSHGVFPMTPTALDAFVRSLDTDRTRIVWAICDVKKHKHIGNITLQAINLLYRSAEFAIIIGEKEYWGKGFAYQASYFLVRHGFEKLNLHRIHCGTAASNAGMRKLAAALKMKEEGIRREALLVDGTFEDCVEFGVLREEFFAR